MTLASPLSSWYPEENFWYAQDTVEEFWDKLGLGDPSSRATVNHLVGDLFVLEPEDLEDEDHALKVSEVTKWSEGISPQTMYERFKPLKIRIPALNKPEDSDGYETGSATEDESDDGECVELPNETGPRPSRRGRKAKPKSKANPDMFPESTQPHLTVPSSTLPTKFRLYQQKGYDLGKPGDPDQTYKAFSANPRPRKGIFRDYSRPCEMDQSLQQLNETTSASPFAEEEDPMNIDTESLNPTLEHASGHSDSEESIDQPAHEAHVDTNMTTIEDDKVFDEFLVYPTDDAMDHGEEPEESNAEASDLGEMELMYPSDGEELDGKGDSEPMTWDVINHEELVVSL
ncbi:hypothetical protein V5O48_013766 [Marasmius crinis-equi]|uniref:Uncharacterized protein n=1 Tax=Marasmius crinis-equi TaxID=585013 RepID=A0ABR3EZ71_9AGAR